MSDFSPFKSQADRGIAVIKFCWVLENLKDLRIPLKTIETDQYINPIEDSVRSLTKKLNLDSRIPNEI